MSVVPFGADPMSAGPVRKAGQGKQVSHRNQSTFPDSALAAGLPDRVSQGRRNADSSELGSRPASSLVARLDGYSNAFFKRDVD